MSSIEPGQVYREAVPRDGRHPTRIVVKALGMYEPGRGCGQVWAATLTENGREIRARWISADQLHASSSTQDGLPRRTGYVLEAGQ